MLLSDQLKADITAALKSGDKERAGILRFLNAQLQTKSIENRGQGKSETLSDEEVVGVFRKEVKKRRESAEMFRKGGRADLAENEEKESATIEAYLPAAASEDDIRAAVAAVRASGATEFPAIIRAVKEKLPNADGAVVARIIKEG